MAWAADLGEGQKQGYWPQERLAMDRRVGNGRFEQGPYVVFGRGHCGGRLLSEAYHRNGIYMGELSKEQRDTEGMGLNNERMVMIVKNAYRYPEAPPPEQHEIERILTEQVESLRREASGKPFGWKMGVSIFCIEILLRTYPEARVIHLIRDGRDVCLSRLDARFTRESFQRRVSASLS